MRSGLGRRLKEQATEIAFPRAAGSKGNERARRIVRDRLVEAGLQVEEQSFSYDLKRAFRAIHWTLRGAAVAVVVAGTLAATRPGVASLALASGTVHRGIECVTFSSGSLGRETMAVHSAKDVANNLCERSLENVYRLVHETARRLTA